MKEPRKIALVGNIAVGKTTIARKLSRLKNIPVLYMDTLQFTQDLKINNLDETRKTLKQFYQKNKWIIDGHGPLDTLEERFQLADQIIFIDPPVLWSYFLLTYRQIKNIFWPRLEFAGKQSELKWEHTKKLYKTVWSIHTKMRPELIRMLKREEFKDKVLTVKICSADCYV